MAVAAALCVVLPAVLVVALLRTWAACDLGINPAANGTFALAVVAPAALAVLAVLTLGAALVVRRPLVVVGCQMAATFTAYVVLAGC